jgi:hypothetical protein
MSLPCQRVALPKCYPYRSPARHTRLFLKDSPPTILHCVLQCPVTPATVVCDHAAQQWWWRLQKSEAFRNGEKRRLKRVCPFPLSWPLLKRHPHLPTVHHTLQ